MLTATIKNSLVVELFNLVQHKIMERLLKYYMRLQPNIICINLLVKKIIQIGSTYGVN